MSFLHLTCIRLFRRFVVFFHPYIFSIWSNADWQNDCVYDCGMNDVDKGTHIVHIIFCSYFVLDVRDRCAQRHANQMIVRKAFRFCFFFLPFVACCAYGGRRAFHCVIPSHSFRLKVFYFKLFPRADQQQQQQQNVSKQQTANEKYVFLRTI